jgi:RNA polymerase-binding transcription factor DksA
MGALLLEFLLRACRHRRQSRPFTLDNQTYKVCLDCGKEIEYSLERMAPISVRERWELKMVKSKKL